MSEIPLPSALVRAPVTWTLGHADTTGPLKAARGFVRFEASAIAVAYSDRTVLPSPVETPFLAGVMSPVDLIVNDPDIWNWKVTVKAGGVAWDPFHINVPAEGTNLASASITPGKGPVKVLKGDRGAQGASLESLEQIADDALRAVIHDPLTGVDDVKVFDLPRGPEGPYGGTEVTDPQVASYVTTPTQTRAALDGSYTRKPGPDERECWVTPRGDDAADGLTLATAKRTIPAAVASLAGAAGTIHLGAGTFTLASGVQATNNLRIVGAGRHLTTVSYTGTGAAIYGTPNARTYNFELSGLHLRGPGKTTDSIGLDLVDMSQATITDFLFSVFGVGVMHRSDYTGGSVYNTFMDGFFTSCGTGVEFGPRGSNGSRWSYVKWGNCDIAVDIYDSNQNNFHACQFEVNGTAIRIGASVAGTSDHNSFDHCRFERNDISWNIVDSRVRGTAITWPATFDTITQIDYGTRTNILAASSQIEPPGGRRQVLVRSGSYTLGVGDDIVVINASGSTATLPDASTIGVGRMYTLKNPRPVDLAVASLGGAIDNEVTVSIAPMQAAGIVSDGANWWTI